MALRPAADDIIRGIQRSLTTHVSPELSSPYAVAQLNYAVHLLNALAAEWDGAAQRLVEDNASLRALAARAAALLAGRDDALAAELRAAAGERDPDVRVSTLSAANDRLRALISRVLAVPGSDRLEPLAALTQDVRQELRDGMPRRLTGAL